MVRWASGILLLAACGSTTMTDAIQMSAVEDGDLILSLDAEPAAVVRAARAALTAEGYKDVQVNEGFLTAEAGERLAMIVARAAGEGSVEVYLLITDGEDEIVEDAAAYRSIADRIRKALQ